MDTLLGRKTTKLSGYWADPCCHASHFRREVEVGWRSETFWLGADICRDLFNIILALANLAGDLIP